MKQRIIVTKDGSHTLYSEQFDATYHSIHGAIVESEHVFIKNGLLFQAERLKSRKLKVLEMGFGTGLNAFLTHVYSQKNDLNIKYHSIEAFPVSIEEIQKLNYSESFSEQDQIFFEKLHSCNWDKDIFISESFSFHKYQCTLESFFSDLKFDLIYYDAFSPTDQPELWQESIFKKMNAYLSENGILVTYCAQGQMKRNMKAAGFTVKALQGPPGKREMTQAFKL